MKSNIWLLLSLSIALGVANATTPPTPDNQVLARPYVAQFAQAQTTQIEEPELSAEEQAVLRRKHFVDRQIELRDWKAELDKQDVQLRQDKNSLSSQLRQNKLESKRVRIDRKALKRNTKELQRERNLFDRKEKQRKKMDKILSGS